jgi:hypothetical protein
VFMLLFYRTFAADERRVCSNVHKQREKKRHFLQLIQYTRSMLSGCA